MPEEYRKYCPKSDETSLEAFFKKGAIMESGFEAQWGLENKKQDQRSEKSADIDAYISKQPERIRPLLQQVREVVRAVAPQAVEKISWNMPTFWQGENLIHFAAFKNHLGIYPGDLSLAPFMDRLEGYRHTKGAIQFPYNTPIDFKLIADITQWRVNCVAEKGEANKQNPKNSQQKKR